MHPYKYNDNITAIYEYGRFHQRKSSNRGILVFNKTSFLTHFLHENCRKSFTLEIFYVFDLFYGILIIITVFPRIICLCVNISIGWLVGCFGLNGPLRQYFSLYRAVSRREGERKEK